MRHLILAALLPIALVACTERQTCESRAKNHMYDIDVQIREARENLERGYAYVKTNAVFTVGARFCSSRGGFALCTGPNLPSYRRVHIDPDAEQAKLSALEKRKIVLQNELARCAVAYPEG